VTSGPVAEEAAKLFEALQAWARGAAASGGAYGAGHVATDAAECRLCPFCQLLGLARSARPETFEHLLDATGSLVAALRSVLDAHERDWASRRSGPLERIDIG